MLKLLINIVILCLTLMLNVISYAQAQNSSDQIIQEQDWLTRQQQNKIEDEKIKNDQELLKKNYKLKNPEEILNQEITENKENKKCFNINKINIQGSKIISNKIKHQITNQYLGKCFDKKIANDLIAKIRQFYHSKGYIAVQVNIPEQNINNQQLIIKIDEGEISRIIINQNNLSDRLQKFTAFGILEKKPLNVNQINQGLLQINRLSSNQAIVKLEPDLKQGQTKVIIENKKKFPGKFRIGHDNLGSEFTGVKRTNFSASYDNLLSLNDNLSLNYTKNFNDNNKKKDLKIYGVNFSLPFVNNNFSYDFSRSEFLGTVNSSNQNIKITGFSNRHSFNHEYLIDAKKNYRLIWFNNLILKNSASYVNNIKLITSQRKLSILNLGFNYLHNFENNYSLYLRPSFVKGLGILNSTKNSQPITKSTPRSRYQAVKFYGSISKKTFLKNSKNPIIFATEIDSQYSWNTLYGSEQIAIGGYYSVRGFRENYLIGDIGYFVRNKISISSSDLLNLITFSNNINKLTLTNNLRFEPFFDYGSVKNYYDSKGGRLSGAGIKTSYQAKYLSASLTYSKALNRSKRLANIKRENQLIFFELSLGI